MLTKDFWYELPPSLIAQKPAQPRNHARLMVVHRASGRLEHARFDDLHRWIGPEDLLILNNSRVIPARLSAEQGTVEIFLLEETSPRHWLAIGRPGKKLQAGQRLILDPLNPSTAAVEVEILRTLPTGERVLHFLRDINLADFGKLPIPPYIEKARQQSGLLPILEEDRNWYQTVYADSAGSVAAPTAGLHFTDQQLQSFNHAFITLHVGLGTFRPIKTETLEEHQMHTERYSIPEGLAQRAKQAKRIIAVGSTTARVLESVPSLRAGDGQTRLFVTPPYTPKRVDALITNFHLPSSTLLVLIASFLGLELQRKAYQEAIAHRYRFYSYGDAMLIL